MANDNGWSLTDHLLALVHDQLAIANWQRSSSPKRKRPRPKPISPLASRGNRMGGGHGRSNEEVADQLARFRTGFYDNNAQPRGRRRIPKGAPGAGRFMKATTD